MEQEKQLNQLTLWANSKEERELEKKAMESADRRAARLKAIQSAEAECASKEWIALLRSH